MREQAKRYKMYKSGKIWVFAGITLITLNLTMINGRADDTDAAPVTDTATQVLPTEQQPELTLNKTEQTSGDNAARAEISDAPASAEAVTTDSQAADTVQEFMVAAPAESHADASVQVSTEQPNQSVVSDQGVEAPAADGQLPVEPAPDVVVDHDSSSVHSDSGQVADHEADEATEIPDSLLVGPDVTATANEQPVLTESKDMVRRQEPRANELERGIQDTRRTEVTGNIGVNWWFDGETGVLSLGGGKLKPWHSMSSPWEWYTWFEQVTKVVITDTIVADKNMAGLFSDLKNVKSYVGLDKIDTSEVVSMRGLFMDNLNLTTLDLSSWNTSKLEEMRLIFGVAIYDRPKFSKLTSINLAGWDTSHVTDLSGAFLYCGSLRTVIGLEQFNTEKVTDMTAVFYGTAFSSLDVSNFSSESLTEMLWMFGGMRNVTSIKLGSKFDAALVQNFRALFVYSPKLEVLDISGLDMSRVTENNGMFLGDFSLKKLTLGPNTNLSKLLEAPSVGLPGPYLSEKYSGRWVNLDDPNDTLTTQELIARYSGNGAAMATYIWEANRAIIDLHDVTIDAGDDWNWSNSIDRLVDQFGNPVDVQALYAANPKAVKLRGDRVNTKRPGTYQVTFKYAGKTVTALVIVKADQTSLNVHDTDLHAGGTWQPQDAFDGATDKDGQPIDFSNVTVTGDVNSAVPGEYQVTYTVGNQS
ncbi:BspA family leucine-rich repeat surface protein [Lactiplantibacillus pentosus]|uniref:BspA family leucine-rich repeat surface protein n=1 Tax=Lactiplantibacillus pentosus TaxID=1589 RepID=UPI003C24654B